MKESMWIKIAKLVAIELLLVCAVLMVATAGNEQSKIYPTTMYVTEIREELDAVILTDTAGNEWEFCGIEDWAIGDICACIMDDNGTEGIEDDRIIDTRYNGNIGRN